MGKVILLIDKVVQGAEKVASISLELKLDFLIGYFGKRKFYRVNDRLLYYVSSRCF